MLNHNNTTHHAPPRRPPKSDQVSRRDRRGLHSVIGWFRTGYPHDAPASGYSPLLALYGPVGLTSGQLDCVAGEVPLPCADRTDIAVAITKATDRLPTDSQIRAARRRVSSPPDPT